ncbi:beta-ketoacyl-[acyl-carrier-protein] synthase family protein [Mariniblastus sp.]|nr:beta-ketoacyl-[acyl-carrier-protein] synthase family protein [Mariniblastus sp.]
MPASDRRVVITGLGLISPLGNSPTELKESLDSGRSGIAKMDLLPTDHLPADFGGECKQFTGKIDNFGPLEKKMQRSIKKGLRLMCREIQMGVAASQLAITDAGLTPESCDPTRIGTLFGSDYIITRPEEFASGVQSCLNDQQEFQMNQWADNGLAKVEPLWLLKYLPNMPASHVAIYNQLRGPSNSLTVREASPSLAIAEATTIIQRGTADIMVAGATGSRIQPLRTLHVVLQEQLADRNAAVAGGDPTKACRPFDVDRNGIVLGEGAGVMILEEFEFAKARGAKILGEVIGYGSSSVASPAGVANYQTAFQNVIEGALETSELSAADIGHVHAHGLGTIRCDAEEAKAINATLGDTPVVAAKSLMGNLGGGSGMVEMIGSLLAVNDGQLFPTANCDSLDPACPINLVTQPGTAAGDTFINLNVTPQGQASSIAIRKA